MERDNARQLPWMIVLLLVAVVCAVSWLGALLIHKSAEDDSFGSYRTMTGLSNLEVQMAGEGFVYYDGSVLSRVDASGGILWSNAVGKGYRFRASGSGVALWSGQNLTLIDLKTGKTLFTGEEEGEILSARVGTRYAAAHVQGENGENVVVMETGGQPIYTAEFDQTSVIDFGFFSSGSLLWAMALDTTGSIPTCEIDTFKPRSMAIIGSIRDPEQLMYSVNFQTTSVCCTGVTYYKVFDYTGTELTDLRRLVYGWYLVSADDTEDPLMAFVPSGQADSTGLMQDVRMMKSNLDLTVRMPFPCNALVASGSRVYGFSSDGHVMVATAGDRQVIAYQMPFFIDRVYGVTSSGAAVVSSGDALHLIQLNE